jgi:hypothetical protein
MRYLLLLIPCVACLATPLYNAVEPRVFGFPLFYWFLLVLVPLSSVFTYLFHRGEDR